MKFSGKNILIDSSFWIGLLFPNDQYHDRSIEIFETIKSFNFVIPYPTLYETINTKLKRNTIGLKKFENILKSPNAQFLTDTEYVDIALEKAIELGGCFHNISLVDWIIRLILQDSQYRIDYFVSFNDKDFIDICLNRKIEIYGC